jgi:hypothetical protein
MRIRLSATILVTPRSSVASDPAERQRKDLHDHQVDRLGTGHTANRHDRAGATVEPVTRVAAATMA